MLNAGNMHRTFEIRINGELRGTPRVQVIASNGEALGVMPLAAALRLAMKQGLDLVEVNPTADPPICKILDFDTVKHAAQQEKLSDRAERRTEHDTDELRSCRAPVAWTAFECDGRALEYLAFEGKENVRPRDWPAHEPSPTPWLSVIIVIVRNPGNGKSSGITFPLGTVVTVDHAIEAARDMWPQLTE